jgi:FkbM family methyltransferase
MTMSDQMAAAFTPDRSEEIIRQIESGRTAANADVADRSIRCLRDAAVSGSLGHSTEVANTLALLGMLNDARAVLAAALERDPNDVTALAILATVESASGRHDAALACFDRTLTLAPDFPGLAERRERCRVEQGVLSRAAQDLETYAADHHLDARDTEDNLIAVDARSLDDVGKPRFRMRLPAGRIRHDLGIALLFSQETAAGGYEMGLRRFLDAHLESDDVFIDVGAHWGIHALTAATRRRGEIAVIAVEPHPANLEHLRRWITDNDLGQDIEIVPAAVGATTGTTFLMANSSMGYRVALCGTEVPISTLDTLLADRDWLRWRRIVLKIDVEGHELAVLEGARQLLDTCDVAAIVWEKGESYGSAAEDPRLRKIVQELDARGFQHFCFRDEHHGGELIPLVELGRTCNVYSLRPGFRRLPRYD